MRWAADRADNLLRPSDGTTPLAYGTSIDQYRKSSVSSASPLRLVIMLYDGALRFMEAGKHAMLRGEIYAQNQNIQKAQSIITELMATLDMEQGGEVAGNLASLYSYIYNQLVQANIEDKPEHIDECVGLLRDLRESWAELEAESTARNAQPKEAGDAA